MQISTGASAPVSAAAVALRPLSRGLASFGVSAKLQVAFGAVAGLTVIAAAVAFISFSSIERGLQRVVGGQVPMVTDTLRLSVISGGISATAARYIGARTVADQNAALTLIAQESNELAAVLDRVRQASGEGPDFRNVVTLLRRLEANLASLEEAISERTRLRTQIDSLLDTLHKVHGHIVDVLPRHVAANEALEISVRAHLLVSLISEGSIIRETTAFKSMQDRLKAATEDLRQITAALPDADLKRSIDELVGFGVGANSVFAKRARELFTTTRVDATIDENVAIQRDLDAAVGRLVDAAVAGMQSGRATLAGDLDRSRTLLLFVALASLLAAAGIGVFYVQRGLVHRLIAIGQAMRRLSSGDVQVVVPAVADHDEIGDMARSLEVFRAGEIERRSLTEREHVDQAAQRRRGADIDQIIGDFRATVTTIIGTVTDNVSRMEATAHTLSTIASEANLQARAVSVSSAATSTNVRTVAGATDQLGSSIREINDQASQAYKVVREATDIALSADQLVGQLSTGADRIGDVVKLIRDIAEQTNLLALNATIEAARAGDAGRGFAVVAAEVKALASQTAGATEDIGTQVGAIQGSTKEAVEAIRSISDVMADISRFTAAIAAAVAQQSTSTQMIVQNVQQAAAGANEVAGSMASVTTAINETSRSAADVLDASHAFSTQAAALEKAVDMFLTRVAAA